ncbi:hypothetical protein SMACR_04552 [Sordaria macrospora]|uniref:Ecp2 effector protein domain-containing protein n=1 Tax=Sordaria macrospora TaxID=5147 RepID=A0A8S8ZHC8_SORMA|nr:hypothetical protein SMACR_04552 [Sordaria macrospora]KAH7631446.1 hypothetical protein B0T09DRAFT_302928 [Sordaria sp. MPI-SDFR-AT-0083]WPJ62771.1 hypothetical protein SMAC4_04552 [Sordaria macrospora]
MKYRTLFSLFVATLSAAIVSAAPSHFGLGLKSGNAASAKRTTAELNTHDAADNSNCVTWTDGHGDLKCNQFSIILGHANLVSIITKNYLTISMLNVTNKYMYLTPTIVLVNTTDILVIKSALKCSGDQWKSFASVLPWTIDTHGGNACNENAYNGPYDNTWVNYAGKHLNVPDDERCKWDKRLGFRCVVGREP